ncbi:MAG TPA: 3'-5' exonuclease [Polyangiales bacterium]|nr:3'-5' exonuclease [Polyangiales bacterium]
MSYLVIDLEATCDERHRIPREQTEIIEIGAVLVNAELRPVDAWQTFVRPVIHPVLTPFCTKLTSIVQAQVDDAPLFAEAIAALATYLAGRTPLFCSWGDYDRAQLAREAERNGITLPLGDQHFNIKEAFNQRVGSAKRRGVGQALHYVGLAFEGTAHRGIDDARNIARLLPYALGPLPL